MTVGRAPGRAAAPRAASLIFQRRFLPLWLAQGLAQVAYSALLFTLLIVVLKATGSSTQTSLLVLAFIAPTLLVGPLAGVMLDRWPKTRVLVVSNAARAGVCALLAILHQHVVAIYLLSLLFSAASLLFNPAVVALLPALVPRERLVDANSLYNLTITAGQLLGMVILAPLVLKLAGVRGEEAMFATGAAMFGAAAVLSLLVPGEGDSEGPAPHLAAMPREMRSALAALRRDRQAALAMVHLVTGNTLVLLFATLIPRYMEDILGISPDNAAFVFAPTGLGALLGLRVLPWLALRLGRQRLVPVGLAGIGVCLVGLALVQPLASFMARASGPLNPEHLLGLSLLQFLTMALAGPLGFSYALLNAPAQTVLHERAPPHMRGRIFAVQAVLASSFSLLPVLFIGGLTDILDSLAAVPGITIVLLLIAAAVGALAVASWPEGSRGRQTTP
ncbi:Lysophospholipid transporter LplT [bacterium HR24]|jgi:MFS family permease|nr:Lysophospholipid transporter LplT [bacterium HR24]